MKKRESPEQSAARVRRPPCARGTHSDQQGSPQPFSELSRGRGDRVRVRGPHRRGASAAPRSCPRRFRTQSRAAEKHARDPPTRLRASSLGSFLSLRRHPRLPPRLPSPFFRLRVTRPTPPDTGPKQRPIDHRLALRSSLLCSRFSSQLHDGVARAFSRWHRQRVARGFGRDDGSLCPQHARPCVFPPACFERFA